MPSSLNADNGVVSGTAGLKSSADSSGVLDLQTNGTTAISISASQVVSFANQPTYTGGTANGVMFLNGSKAVTTGTALTFDGSQLDIPLGSAGTPSLSTPTDPNTGMFFPAADTIAFAEGGVEAMRLDSSGNMGVGTTSPAARLDVSGGSIRVNEDGVGTKILTIRSNWAGVDPAINVTTSNALLLMTANTERARISAAGNFGIGTASPSRKLDVNGAAVVQGGVLNTTSYYETTIESPYFTNGVANLAVDVRFGNNSFWGYIEIELSGTFSNQNVAGKLSKLFAVGTNPGGLIYTNETRVTDCIGAISAGFTIGDFSWDAANSTFRIPIYHVTSLGNSVMVRIKQFAAFGAASDAFSSLTLSNLYTSGAIAPISGVNFNTAVGIGGAAAASSGAGITFPATQVASSNANTLDDYEEGTFTPAFASGTFTYGTRTGFYTKVGRLVTVNFFIMWSAKSGSGTLSVNGFPFTATSAASFRATGAVGYTAGVGFAAGTQITWAMSENYTGADLAIVITGATTQFANVSNMSATGEIQGTISYIV